ncbi:hypothetical protein [Burkholderia stabilis]|uniref:hypothetical protein n=1 Tax=Burkholderia stabilis TaxID=95485 RepID=UPI001F4A76F1|nr:hypothetical protein [Burkholderia stabilis]
MQRIDAQRDELVHQRDRTAHRGAVQRRGSFFRPPQRQKLGRNRGNVPKADTQSHIGRQRVGDPALAERIRIAPAETHFARAPDAFERHREDARRRLANGFARPRRAIAVGGAIGERPLERDGVVGAQRFRHVRVVVVDALLVRRLLRVYAIAAAHVVLEHNGQPQDQHGKQHLQPETPGEARCTPRFAICCVGQQRDADNDTDDGTGLVEENQPTDKQDERQITTERYRADRQQSGREQPPQRDARYPQQHGRKSACACGWFDLFGWTCVGTCGRRAGISMIGTHYALSFF